MPHVRIAMTVDPEYQDSVDSVLVEKAASLAVRTGLTHDTTHPLRKLIASQESLEMSLLISGDATMHALNRHYRGVDRPTDVLSFSLVEGGRQLLDAAMHLGDVALSYSYIKRQAAELGHGVNKELAWLTVHGTLQLLGYHHSTEANATEMECLEADVLRGLGFGGTDAE